MSPIIAAISFDNLTSSNLSSEFKVQQCSDTIASIILRSICRRFFSALPLTIFDDESSDSIQYYWIKKLLLFFGYIDIQVCPHFLLFNIKFGTVTELDGVSEQLEFG